MSVLVGENLFISSGDKVLIFSNDTRTEGEIVVSGEGQLDTESPEFLLLAPSFLDNPFDENDQSRDFTFLIVKVHSRLLLFPQLPIDTEIEAQATNYENESERTVMIIPITITAFIGCNNPDHHYICAILKNRFI